MLRTGMLANLIDNALRHGRSTSDGERVGEGAGLGLAIVTRYAELLDARFELGAAPNGPGLRASLVLKHAEAP